MDRIGKGDSIPEDLRVLSEEILGEIMDRNMRDERNGKIPLGDGNPRDPALEEKMRTYFHTQPVELARRFLLNLYDDALGDSVDLLRQYSGAELCGYGCQLAGSGHYARAYGVLSLALLKGEDHARDLLDQVAGILRDRSIRTPIDTFTYCKRTMERVMRFVRTPPPSPRGRGQGEG